MKKLIIFLSRTLIVYSIFILFGGGLLFLLGESTGHNPLLTDDWRGTLSTIIIILGMPAVSLLDFMQITEPGFLIATESKVSLFFEHMALGSGLLLASLVINLLIKEDRNRLFRLGLILLLFYVLVFSISELLISIM